MTTWFVSRHPGALEWIRRQGVAVDRMVPHLDPRDVGHGDTVIGTLPVNRAAELQARGARYVHLALELPPDWRGRELSADDMEAIGACLREYRVTAGDDP